MNAQNCLQALCCLCIIILSCESPKNTPSDTLNSGVIQISADESFEPVIREAVEAFVALHPEAAINVDYRPETECMKAFFTDSATRLVITGRGLTDAEDSLIRSRLGYAAAWNLLAFDGIAIVVNQNSTDTAFTISELQNILTGKVKTRRVIFDGLTATSTLRYVKDSILKGSSFDTSTVKTAAGSADVIKYIANHRDAIGLVGVSWIGNPEAPDQKEWRKKVRIVPVFCETCRPREYQLPSREALNAGLYPLTRGLYYLLKENYSGLGTGFVDFLKFEQGQLIFRRAYLRPVMNFDTRNVNIDTSVKR